MIRAQWISWLPVVAWAVLCLSHVAGNPVYQRGVSTNIQGRELRDRETACMALGTCGGLKRDKPDEHLPPSKKDDVDSDHHEDEEPFEDPDEPGEKVDNDEDYEDNAPPEKRAIGLKDRNPTKKKYLIRSIPDLVTGKLYSAAWAALGKDRRAMQARKKGKEWHFVESKGKTYKHTEVDHLIEIQRFKRIFVEPKTPHGKGIDQGKWDILRKIVDDDTDNNDPHKKRLGHILNSQNNLRGLNSRPNLLKGKICMRTDKGTSGPDYKNSWARSTLWQVAKAYKAFKDQYATNSKSLGEFTKDVGGGDELKAYVEEELDRRYKADVKHIKDNLKLPIKKNKENFFKEDMDKVPPV